MNDGTGDCLALLEDPTIFQVQQIMCIGSSFTSHERTWECSGCSVSTVAYGLEGEPEMTWMVKQKHLSNNSANEIVETQLFCTPTKSELRFMKGLHKNGVCVCENESYCILNRYD